jgi:hypothetical protein
LQILFSDCCQGFGVRHHSFERIHFLGCSSLPLSCDGSSL